MKNGLTSTEVVEIIDACSKNGVYTLEFGDLKLTLGKVPSDPMYMSPDVYYEQPLPAKLDTTGEMEHNEEDTKQSAEELADIMEELKLTDPVAYEDIQLNGEILND